MKFPPQHGAWAFLIVPAAMVAFLGAGNLVGLVFFLTWVSGYPVSYFIGRAIVARIRRGSWTAKAKGELRWAMPWLAISVVGGTVLVILRPWLLFYAILVIGLWSTSVYLSWAGRERGITNDLLLIGLASIEPVLMYQAARNHSSLIGIPHSVWVATLFCLLFFTGSVVHVKSLIREVKNRKWHYASLIFHVVAFVMILVFLNPKYLAIPFGLALLRTVLLKPGHRPGVLGGVEAVVALSLIFCVVVAVG